ncbi:MAG: polysaccharide deacetylase family protein [Firmicutes bacterium]|nr:polysaccharide deacetylase family protein [Bacillota bacterium]
MKLPLIQHKTFGEETDIKLMLEKPQDIVERGVDFLLDTRLSHAWPHALIRAFRFKNKIRSFQQDLVRMALTVDLEGNFRDTENSSVAVAFLPTFDLWCNMRNIQSTIFIQGSIVKQISPYRDILTAHDIGLHGLHHEVWGRSRWWQYSLKYSGLSLSEKEDRLQKALSIFREENLPPPRHFRAPYLNINGPTLSLLAKYGFVSDSSAASYLGCLPIPQKKSGLWELPVTTRPFPDKVNYGLQRFYYPEFSLGALLKTPINVTIDTINLVSTLQKQYGYTPHIVILMHPWEFTSNTGVSHASEKNYDKLGALLDQLQEHFKILPVTMTDLTLQVSTAEKLI